MDVNIVDCLFVLESEKNTNIRKNDIKTIKVLVDNDNNLPFVKSSENDIKMSIRNHINNIIGTNTFHLEQVLSVNKKNILDIIYLSITNIENIKNDLNNYKLVNFKIENNNTIIFDDKQYKYKTIETEENNNIEYRHEITINDENLKRTLMYLLTSYKRIRSNIDSTDIMFKFMSKTFTLEDVRIVYELIKDTKVDKSNFRKKIIKYCEKVDTKDRNNNGFRPSQKYKFKPLKGDIWI